MTKLSYTPDYAEAVDGPEAKGSEYREAARRMLDILSSAMERIASSENPQLAAWHVSFALGLPCCWGESMRTVAKGLGVSVEVVSKGAVAFCIENGLPPSQYMKSEDARDSYSESRIKQLNKPQIES